MNNIENGNWNSWAVYVLKELERLNSCYSSLDDKIGKIQQDIAMLKVKAGIWGAIGGCIPIIIMLAIKFIEKK
jgi:hypothetical protein